MDVLEEEARIFTHYLIGKQADSQTIELYKAAVSSSKLNDADQKLLHFMLSHPKTIGLIDAGLVFHNSSSEARRRLYTILAILEANAEYYDSFLSKDRNPLYILVIAYSCARAVVKALLGILLVKAIE
jgi:hypothetical protein